MFEHACRSARWISARRDSNPSSRARRCRPLLRAAVGSRVFGSTVERHARCGDDSPRSAVLHASAWVTFGNEVRPENIDAWFRDREAPDGPNTWLAAAGNTAGLLRSNRTVGTQGSEKPVDFGIFCPNTSCELNQDVGWAEATPWGPWPVRAAFASPLEGCRAARFRHGPLTNRYTSGALHGRGHGGQVCASLFRAKGSFLFGNVERFNEHLGFYRRWCAPLGPGSLPTGLLRILDSAGTFPWVS
jgi:hypothetical protein